MCQGEHMIRKFRRALWTLTLASGIAAMTPQAMSQTPISPPPDAPKSFPDFLRELPSVQQKDTPPASQQAVQPKDAVKTDATTSMVYSQGGATMMPQDPQFYASADYLLWWI